MNVQAAGAVTETLKPDAAITAAAFAYFALFSLFPITLLSIAIASYSLGPMIDQQLIIQRRSLLHRPWANCWGKILMKLSKRADQLLALL
jgi:uncharacterized BrkB/YihY/UPF0761 family membrane protein